MPQGISDHLDLRASFSHHDNARLEGFLQAFEDQPFKSALAGNRILDVRLQGDTGPAALPNAETLFFDGAELVGEFSGQADVVVAAAALQRVVSPFRLLSALYPLLATNGVLILSVPYRTAAGGDLARFSTPSLRYYTLASLYLELQAAWGLGAFRVRYVRELFEAEPDAARREAQPHALILVAEKTGVRGVYPNLPRLALDRHGLVYNRSDDEKTLVIDAGGLLNPSIDPASFSRICVIKLDHIGDFVMGVPAYDDIRQLFPAAHIVCVCGTWNAQMARDLGCFDEVVPCDYYSSGAEGMHTAHTMAIAAQRLGERFAGTEFDLAIDLRVPDDSREIVRIVPARYRAAIGRADKFPFLDVALPPIDSFNQGHHLVPEAASVHVPVEHFSYRSSVAASPPEVRIVPFETGGHLIWGPYRPLPRGCYRATWMLTTATVPARVKVDVAVYDDARRVVAVLASAVVDVHHNATPTPLDFELYADMDRVEFRMEPEGDAEGAIFIFAGVQLNLISGRPSTRQLPQAQLHMKEQMALLVALVRTRLLAPVRRPDQIRDAIAPNPDAGGSPFFAVVPFSNSVVRDWPASSFVRLCQLLLNETEASVRLIGSPAQRDALEALVVEIGSDRIENHAGVSWPEVYASFAHAEVVITNNSGMGHVAAMLGARVLAIYSGSHQALEWAPVGPDVSVLQASLPCGACGFDTVGECLHGLRCTQAITPAAALGSLRELAPALFPTPATGALSAMNADPNRTSYRKQTLAERIRKLFSAPR